MRLRRRNVTTLRISGPALILPSWAAGAAEHVALEVARRDVTALLDRPGRRLCPLEHPRRQIGGQDVDVPARAARRAAPWPARRAPRRSTRRRSRPTTRRGRRPASASASQPGQSVSFTKEKCFGLRKNQVSLVETASSRRTSSSPPVVDDVAVVLAEGLELEGAHPPHEPADQHRLLASPQVNASLPADQRLEQCELVVADLRHRLRTRPALARAAGLTGLDASPTRRRRGVGGGAAGGGEASMRGDAQELGGGEQAVACRGTARSGRRSGRHPAGTRTGCGSRSPAPASSRRPRTSMTRPSSGVSSPAATASPLHDQIHHDQVGAGAEGRPRKPELDRQVDDRDDVAAQVHHAPHDRRHRRDGR